MFAEKILAIKFSCFNHSKNFLSNYFNFKMGNLN